MNKSESIKELASALSLAQGQMEAAKKDKENPFFRSHYSDLASVWEACREPLSKHGLSVSQLTDVEEGKLVIESVLMHKSGEWISGRLAMPIAKNDPQSMGSLISYGRRYALGAIVGVVSEEDNDAEGTMDRGKKEEKKPPKQEAKKDEIPEFSTENGPLTFDELREKILATTALPHLKNIWVKYKADVAILSVEEAERLAAVKDAKKKELQGGANE